MVTPLRTRAKSVYDTYDVTVHDRQWSPKHHTGMQLFHRVYLTGSHGKAKPGKVTATHGPLRCLALTLNSIITTASTRFVGS